MLRIDAGGTALGLSQDTYYNWHKSIGLVALVVAVLRLVARKHGELPPWAPGLSKAERKFVHRAEQVLYAAMFAMPVSGYLYVMAGGYRGEPVRRPPICPIRSAHGRPWPSSPSGSTSFASYALLLALAGHLGLVLRHHLILKDGLLYRMLPGSRADKS